MLSTNEKWLVAMVIIGCVFFASLTPVWMGACLIGLGWMGDSRDKLTKIKKVQVWSFRSALLMTLIGAAMIIARMKFGEVSWSAGISSPKTAAAALATYATALLCTPVCISAYIQQRNHYRKMVRIRMMGSGSQTLAKFTKCCSVMKVPTAV